jgi:zinc protease
VEKEFFNEIELLRAQGLTAEELNRSKAKLIGQRKIARQDLGTHATGAALDELYGLGYDFGDKEDEKIQAATLEQITNVAQKYLLPNTAVISIVQPES